jgi:hypothetical protein
MIEPDPAYSTDVTMPRLARFPPSPAPAPLLASGEIQGVSLPDLPWRLTRVALEWDLKRGEHGTGDRRGRCGREAVVGREEHQVEVSAGYGGDQDRSHQHVTS